MPEKASLEYNIKTIKGGADQLRRQVGALIMTAFGVIALWRWQETGFVFFLLLSFRDAVAAYFLSVRSDAVLRSKSWIDVFAYISSAIPLFYFGHIAGVNKYAIAAANILAIAGFLLATLSTIELGKRMGVGPARRGEVCRTGVYKYIKHPMYVGYVVAELGNVLLNPLNVILYLSSVGSYWIRANIESRLLSDEP